MVEDRMPLGSCTYRPIRLGTGIFPFHLQEEVCSCPREVQGNDSDRLRGIVQWENRSCRQAARLMFGGRKEEVVHLRDCGRPTAWTRRCATPRAPHQSAVRPPTAQFDPTASVEQSPTLWTFRLNFEAAFFTVRSIFFPTPSLSQDEASLIPYI